MVAEVLLRLRTSRSRGRLIRFAALLTGAAVLLSILGMGTAVAWAAPPVQAGGVSLTVAPDGGGILIPAENLNVTVTVDNTGAEPISAGTAVLWMVDTPVTTTANLSSWLTGSGAPATKTQLATTPTDLLEPGIPASYRISVPAADLTAAGLPGAGSTGSGSTGTGSATYGIGVSLLTGSTTTAVSRSVIVWNEGSGPASVQTHVTIAMPLTVAPSADGIISAADLATDTAPGGILTRQLDAIMANPGVAVGIDPMIIASIRILNNAAPPSAVNWLRLLSQIVNPTFALQYGDADPAGQIQAGVGKLLQPSSFTYAMNPADFKTPETPIGEPAAQTPVPTSSATPRPNAKNPNLPTTKELLAWPYTFSGFAWPADDTVHSADLAAFASNGLHTTILASGNTNAATLSGTPNAALKVGHDTALVADEALSDAVQQAVLATSTATWNAAMADVNAQLQLISAGEKTAGSILVTLNRDAPTVSGQLSHVLSVVSNSPWSTSASLQDALDATPTSGLSIKDAPESSSRIASIQTLVARESSVDAFATVLDDPQTLIGATRNQLLTTLAVGWLDPKQNWEPGVSTFLRTTTQILTSVSILATDNVNLVGTQGSIPFTVSNDLPNEAVTVVLSASPSNSRLDISGDTTKRIQADSRTTVLVPVKAELGNGKVTLQLQLYSQSGVKIGSPTTVPVEVHADWEGIGALIIGVLLVLLFGFGIVRNVLRRRSKQGGAADGPADSAADGPANSAADGPANSAADGPADSGTDGTPDRATANGPASNTAGGTASPDAASPDAATPSAATPDAAPANAATADSPEDAPANAATSRTPDEDARG